LSYFGTGSTMKKLGKYEVIEEIGKGAMGIVYKAFDPLMGRYVALKTMSYSNASDPEFKKRFFKEAQAPGRLHHENIVIIYELNEDQGVPFIAMEFLEGDDLFHLIHSGHIFTLQRIMEITIQICDGLHFAHSNGIIHRDIKPANIFILRNGKIKIVDFGIAHISQSSLMTKTGMLLGTPSYMSPEQVKCETLTGRSDLFSLGVILYELLTGRRPFDGDTYTNILFKILNEEPKPLCELYPSCPAPLEKTIMKALNKNPNDRYMDLSSMARRFRKLKEEFEEDMSMEPTIAVPRSKVEEQSLKIDLVNRYIKEDKFDQALRVLDKLKAQGESQEILEALQEDINEKKQLARIEMLFEEGENFFDDEHFDLALECFNEVLTLAPENSRALEWVRKTHEKEAEKRLSKTIAKYMDMGDDAMKKEDFQEAEKLYSEALKLNPASKDISLKLTDVQKLLQYREKKLQCDALSQKARQNFEKGQRETARRFCREALGILSDHQPAREILEVIEAEERDEVVQKTLQDMEALFLRKKYDEALALASQAVEKVGIDPRLTKSTRRIIQAKRRKVLIPVLLVLVAAAIVLTVLTLLRPEPAPPPPPIPNGILMLDIRPEVTILELVNTETNHTVQLVDKETPLRLMLPPGSYRMSYQNTQYQKESEVEEFTIESEKTQSITKIIPGFDVDETIEKILTREDGP